jgi:hypothetical protein
MHALFHVLMLLLLLLLLLARKAATAVHFNSSCSALIKLCTADYVQALPRAFQACSITRSALRCDVQRILPPTLLLRLAAAAGCCSSSCCSQLLSSHTAVQPHTWLITLSTAAPVVKVILHSNHSSATLTAQLLHKWLQLRQQRWVAVQVHNCCATIAQCI